jgi:PAS domain S-box-containing protein
MTVERRTTINNTAKRRRTGKIPEWRAEDFRTIVTRNADAMIVLDREGYVVYVNPAAQSLFNLPSDEMVGSNFGFPIILNEPVEMYILREFRDFVAAEMRMVEVVWAGELSYLLSFRDLTDRIMAEKTLSQARDEQEVMVQKRTYQLNEINESLRREIEERKRAEEKITHLASFPELNPNPVIEVSTDGAVKYANPATDRLFPDLKALGADHPLLTGFHDLVSELEKGGSVLVRDVEYGDVFYQQTIHSIPETDIVRFYNLDITERKRVEDALRDGEERFRALADNIPNLAWMANPDGWIFWYNKQWYDYTGTSLEEMQGWGWQKVHHPDYVKAVTEEWSSCIKAGQPYDNIFPLRGKDGNFRWFLTRITPIRDEHGNIQRWFGTNTDITERKRAEEGLRESEEKFRILTETASAAICILQDGKFQYINRATETITGYNSDELIAMDFISVIHPDSRGYVVGLYSNWLAGLIRQARFETKILCKNGEEHYVDISVSTIDYLGRPGLILTAIDITERKRAEEVLIEAKQQAELYVDLMGHDISNMNHSTMGYLELAIETLESEKRLGLDDKPLIERPMRVLEGSSALIDNVRKLQMLMTEGIKTKPTNLNKIFRELEAMSFHSHDREVLINIQPVPGYMVEANELLKDVFVNLITNAIKHSDEEKPLTVNVKADPVDENGRKYYRCMVEDDGHGIPDELKSKLFHRFHRGATRAHGKGLGLYIVRTLVEGYHGKVWVEDRVPGDHMKGARFVVMLPAVDA